MESRKLGCNRSPHNPKAFMLRDFVCGPLIYRPVVRWTDPFDATGNQYGIMLNDVEGICVGAAAGHKIQIRTAAANALVMVPDGAIQVAYEDVGGYDPSQTDSTGYNPTDNGMDPQALLDYWRKTGIFGHKILAHAQVHPADLDMVRYAIDNLEGLMVSLDLPQAWYHAPQGQVWDIGCDVTPDPNAGHEVLAVNYDEYGFDLLTWGYLQRITNAGFTLAVIRADATIAPDMADPLTGKTPIGFDMDQLRADLTAIHG